MKKFSFSLDTVLEYKNEILENLRNEHGKIISQIVKQEEQIRFLQEKYHNCNQVFNDKKYNGITIIEASSYESYLRELESEIALEFSKLEVLKELAEEKRNEVVEAKKETASIDKLKEKKVEQYNKEVAKSEELFIEEFVAYCRTAN